MPGTREGLRLGGNSMGMGQVGAHGASDTEASGGSEQGSDPKSDMVFKTPCCNVESGLRERGGRGKEGFRELAGEATPIIQAR